MEMPEIHPAVEAGNVRARRAVSVRCDVESARATGERLRKSIVDLATYYEVKERRRVNRALLIRAAVLLAWVAGLWTAQAFDYISVELAVALEAGGLIWFSVWLGAWLQLRFCKEGLLK